jgi:hypothetical protein
MIDAGFILYAISEKEQEKEVNQNDPERKLQLEREIAALIGRLECQR